MIDKLKTIQILGRFNLIDLMIGVGIIAFGVIAFKSYQILSTPQAPIPWKTGQNVEVWCFFDQLTEEEVAVLQVGAQDLDPAGQPVAEILEVLPPQPTQLAARFHKKVVIPIQSTKVLYQVPARLRLYGDIRLDGHFYSKGRQLEVGRFIAFRTDSREVSGIIRPGLPEEVYALVRAKAEKGIVGQMAPGDPVYQLEGFHVGQVLRIDPDLETLDEQWVDVWVKLRCWKYGSQWIVHTRPIKIGYIFQLESDRYNLIGRVQTLQNEPPAPLPPPAVEDPELEALTKAEEILEPVETYPVYYGVFSMVSRQIPINLLKVIQPDDPVMDSEENVVGSILSVENLGPRPVYQFQEDLNGNVMLLPEQRLSEIRLRVSLFASKKKPLIGINWTVITPTALVKGVISEIDQLGSFEQIKESDANH